MSKRFKDFLNQNQPQPEAKEAGVLIDGAFACTTCYYQCDEAEWFPPKKLLVWQCPDGHRSEIKDFKGF